MNTLSTDKEYEYIEDSDGVKYRVVEVESDCIYLVDENGKRFCIDTHSDCWYLYEY